MSLARTAPRWMPWPMRQGVAAPQLFRWVDDEGPAPILPDTELLLRIILPPEAGAAPVVIEKRLSADAEFTLLDEGSEETRGFFVFQPTPDLVALLPIRPQATYSITAEVEGYSAVLAQGVIDMHPAEVPG